MKKIPTQFERVKLRDWLKLNDLYEKLLSAVDIDTKADLIQEYISTATEGFNIQDFSWVETAEVLSQLVEINHPSLEFPVLKQGVENKKPLWDYDGRTWYVWLHLLSDAYGWEIEYVAELDIDDAVGLIQEILVDEQMKREWDWTRSEIAYPYDKSSKTSRFKPLPRPMWMKSGQTPKELPKVKINEKYMPVGNVVSYKDVKH